MAEEIADNVSEVQDIQEISEPDAANIQDTPAEIQENVEAAEEILPEPVPLARADGAPTGAPAAKRRGRPAGSRNKPKIVAVPVAVEELGDEEPPTPPAEPVSSRARRAPVPAARAKGAPPPSPSRAVSTWREEPPWAKHASAAAYLEEQLRELKRHQQMAKHEMWGQLIRGHM